MLNWHTTRCQPSMLRSRTGSLPAWYLVCDVPCVRTAACGGYSTKSTPAREELTKSPGTPHRPSDPRFAIGNIAIRHISPPAGIWP